MAVVTEQGRARWTRLVADFQASELTQREVRGGARHLVQQPAHLALPLAQGVSPARSYFKTPPVA